MEVKTIRKAASGTRGLSVEAVAGELGLSIPTVWRKIREGSLKAVKCGGRTLVMRQELERFIESLPVWEVAA